jgi:hypothetical protein
MVFFTFTKAELRLAKELSNIFRANHNTMIFTFFNHFNSSFAGYGKGWWPREIDSMGRYKQSGAIGGYELEREHFGWLQAPIINANTRLCMIADAASRRLMVQGYEGSLTVTELFNQQGLSHEQQQVI